MNSSLSSDETSDILIVDDTPENLRLLAIILQEQGYEVRKAMSGERALLAVETLPPELILLDINMPKMDGYEVCRRLKANPQTSHIPILFISALNQPIDKVTAFEVGGVDYIIKPFQEQEVLARVESHLKLNRMQRQLQVLNQNLESRVAERTAQLQAANAQLRELEGELRHSLAQKQELVNILETQNKILVEANQLKDEFLNTISHELRTPLNSVINCVQLLLEGFSDSQRETLELLSQAAQSAQHLSDLIENILVASALKAGQISLDFETIDLSTCLQKVIDPMQSRLNAKNLRFEQHLDSLPLMVRANPEKLQQVFANLLDNAIKFTRAGGTIALKSRQTFNPKTGQTLATVTIQDSGIGIPLDHQHKLFRPFTMVDGSTTRPQGGAGLGLVIAKGYLELMSGQISLESAGQNQGTTVTVSLPLVIIMT